MDPQRRHEREVERDHFTVIAESIGQGAWHLTVRELPATWTVAFAVEELSARARQRIALDLGVAPGDFDVTVVRNAGLFVERRGSHRERDG